MTPLTILLPESIAEAEARFCLAAKLFEMGRVSGGQAAEMAGYSKRTFLELLGKAGIPVFDVSPDELGSDLQNA